MYIDGRKVLGYVGNTVHKVSIFIEKIVKIFTQQRKTVNGIVICNPISNITVGDEYALMAYLLPANNMLNDNLVVISSSNPSVITIEYGVLKAVSVGTARITVEDYDRKYRKSISIAVTEKEISTISESEIYTVNASNYEISIDGTNDVATTNGIISAIAFASNNGYKKIIFPKGKYTVTPEVATNPTKYVIDIPSNLIVDFNNSTVNISPTDISLTGYRMFTFGAINHCENSSIINTNIVGDILTNSNKPDKLSEFCISVHFYDATNCGLDNCDLSYSAGHNISSLRYPKTTDAMKPILGSNTEAGKYDEYGNEVTIEKWWRTINKIDISALYGSFELGNIEGYSGYTALVARLYDICFYDINNKFISSIQNCLQFYRYELPIDAYYCSISFHQTNQPSGDIGGIYGGLGTVATIYTNTEPLYCYIRKCNIHHNHDLGMAITGGKHWYIEKNTFEENGYHYNFAVNSDIDIEDGWDSCNNIVIRNNTFNSSIGIVMVSSINTIIHDNVFNNSTQILGAESGTNGRVQFFRIYKNTYTGTTVSIVVQNECVLAENTFNNCIVKTPVTYHTGAEYTCRLMKNIYNQG